MKRIFARLVLVAFPTVLAFANPTPSLLAAQRAQVLLGSEVWSRTIRIENTGSTTRYPRTLHALVFEAGGVLWFYTDCEGTQYFSTYRGHLAQDKADFAPLLHEIHPGFQQWTVVEATIPPDTAKAAALPNGCFVESLANLRQRLITGGAVLQPRILCYFAKSGGRRLGHAVLTFETDRGVQVIDPEWPKARLVFPPTLAENAQALGAALSGGQAEKALWVPVSDFAATLAAHGTGKSDTAMNHDMRRTKAPLTAGSG